MATESEEREAEAANLEALFSIFVIELLSESWHNQVPHQVVLARLSRRVDEAIKIAPSSRLLVHCKELFTELERLDQLDPQIAKVIITRLCYEIAVGDAVSPV